MVSSSSPTVLTQYPRDQKCSPVTRLFPKTSLWIQTALLPFKNPITKAMLNFGGTLKHMWIWSGIRCPSNNSIRFCLHKSRIISPMRLRTFPYITLLRNLGIITTWYLQSHRTCDKLCQSCIGSSSSSPLRGFPGGRTYNISPRIGRTSPGPPLEAVGLITTKRRRKWR
jgi:hypothetical protein